VIVGFVGLGRMGSGMARNLLKAGHALTVFNRTQDKASPLAALGARVAEQPSGAAFSDVVITMLADDRAVEDVMFGEAGLLRAMSHHSIHVSMSTISVDLSERLTSAHREAGQTFVAAPVFGRPDMAGAAKLFIVAGGPDAAIARCQPLFDAMGQRTFSAGERPADANLIKLTGNFLIASAIESLGEAVALVRWAGVDPARYLEILTSSLFTAPIYKTYGDIIAAERYQPGGFATGLGLKDIRLALAAADAEGVPMPVASLLRDRFLTLVARGDHESDWAALAKLAAHDAGL
jgi:3-hydroxyisobutyrate dehydrogenase-like beta-hydroxyacid dehydrogenase